MSFDPSTSPQKVVNITFAGQTPTKFENLNNLNNSRGMKSSCMRPLLHPSFTQKIPQKKSLPVLKSRVEFRCVTRQIPRKNESIFDNSNSATLMISDRSKSSKNDDSATINTNFQQHLKKSSYSHIKIPIFQTSQTNTLKRNNSVNWMKSRKNSNSSDIDQFHCSKFLSNSKLTNFYDLLGVYYESPSVFPYFNKNTKENPKEFLKPKATTSEENGQSKKSLQKKKNSLFLRRISLVPVLETRHFDPIRVKFNENLLILNLESLTIGKTIQIRPGVLKILKKINEILHIVLVSSINSDSYEDVIRNFALANIKISAFYGVSKVLVKNFKFLDYSEVFDDFGIESGLKQTMIVSNHVLFDIEDCFEHVGSRFGAKLKINCEKVPAARCGSCDSPVVVLLPGFISGRPVKRLRDLVDMINAEIEHDTGLDFFEIYKKMNGFRYDLPNEVLKNYLSVNEKFAQKYYFRHNQYFII